jgi:cytochrome P450
MVRETMNRVVMRKPPLVNFVPRFAAEDTRLGNYTIRAGDPVWVSSAAAHADPLFAGQMTTGSSISSRAHLSWGAGRRQCPARELASTIAMAGVSRVFERFDHLELALPVDQLPWRSSPFMRGLRSLPVRYELAGPVPARPSAPVADVPDLPDAPPVPDQAAKRRSALWRYLAGLIRSNG